MPGQTPGQLSLKDALLLMTLQRLQQDQVGSSQSAPTEGLGRTVKQGKEAYDLVNQVKDLFGNAGGAEAGSSGLEALGNSATKPGFSSIGEMLGNGRYTPLGGTGTEAGAGGNGLFTPISGGGESVTSAAPGGAFDISGFGSAGNAYLPALGAIGAFDLLKNNRIGKRGYLQGAASGAAMGSYFGPWGALIGGGVGLGMGGANELFDTNKYKSEGNRLDKLIKSGIKVPDSYQAPMKLQRGRKKEELVNPKYAADFVGQTADGFINNKFANSRNVKDLAPEDLTGYSAFFEKYGNDWLGKFNEQQRKEIARKALAAGAVREHHGTIDVDWGKVDSPAQPQASANKPTVPPKTLPSLNVQKRPYHWK